MQFYDTISLTFDFVIIYAAIIAVYFYVKSQRHKKRAVSLSFIMRWNDGGYQKTFSNILADPENKDRDIRNIVRDAAFSFNEPQSQNVERIWNFFEELSIAILFGEADEELAREFFLYSLQSTYKISEKAFYELRESSSGTALYRNFERIYGKWAFDKEYTLVKEVSK